MIQSYPSISRILDTIIWGFAELILCFGTKRYEVGAFSSGSGMYLLLIDSEYSVVYYDRQDE